MRDQCRCRACAASSICPQTLLSSEPNMCTILDEAIDDVTRRLDLAKFHRTNHPFGYCAG